MKVTYSGPHDAVEIAATGQTCKNGASVEVPDELGKSLIQQADWSAAVTKKES
jgi:hypothetical protein